MPSLQKAFFLDFPKVGDKSGGGSLFIQVGPQGQGLLPRGLPWGVSRYDAGAAARLGFGETLMSHLPRLFGKCRLVEFLILMLAALTASHVLGA
ncbi:MAG: hypothetical protein U1A77_24765 [Pirellulales bacterium]